MQDGPLEMNESVYQRISRLLFEENTNAINLHLNTTLQHLFSMNIFSNIFSLSTVKYIWRGRSTYHWRKYLVIIYQRKKINIVTGVTLRRLGSRKRIATVCSNERKFPFSRRFLHCSNRFTVYIWRENGKVFSFERMI